MKSEAVKNVLELIRSDSRISDYKINIHKKESFELFYVKGKLETARCTDTCDRQVTVYVDHDGFRGDAAFFLYPSTSREQMESELQRAVRNALLIQNAPYTLPGPESTEEALPTNLQDAPMAVIAEQIADAVFAANTQPGGSLNSVEVFLTRHQESVCNSCGIQKTQQRWTAMVEAIPTFNGDRESVELYEQYNFSSLDLSALTAEIREKMTAVKARYEAVKLDFSLSCPVILNRQELHELFTAVADDLDYGTVYNHGNCFHKGENLQENRTGDPITLCMKGMIRGNVASSSFDGDGLSLGEITLIQDGRVENYFGSSRFGQYLGETPTGNLSCLCVSPGTFSGIEKGPWLEVLSMSGLQVDFFNDYIGGEIRLALYHDEDRVLPVTGISVSGKLRSALSHLRLSRTTATHDGYTGPACAALDQLTIF